MRPQCGLSVCLSDFTVHPLTHSNHVTIDFFITPKADREVSFCYSGHIKTHYPSSQPSVLCLNFLDKKEMWQHPRPAIDTCVHLLLKSNLFLSETHLIHPAPDFCFF